MTNISFGSSPALKQILHSQAFIVNFVTEVVYSMLYFKLYLLLVLVHLFLKVSPIVRFSENSDGEVQNVIFKKKS